MSLLVNIFKTNKDKWDNFTNGKNSCDVYDMMYLGGNGEHYMKLELTYLGTFFGSKYPYEIANKIHGAEMDTYVGFTKEQLYQAKQEIEGDDAFDSWFLAVYNTTNEDEILIIQLD